MSSMLKELESISIVAQVECKHKTASDDIVTLTSVSELHGRLTEAAQALYSYLEIKRMNHPNNMFVSVDEVAKLLKIKSDVTLTLLPAGKIGW